MILQIIDDVDLDNNGTIDYEEFLRALHPDFNETPNWFYGGKKQNDSDHEDSKTDDSYADDENADEDNIDFHDDIMDQQVIDVKEITQTNINKDKKKLNMDAIAKQGYMMKEGKMWRSWKKRWFVLQNNGIMSYYHNEQESNPIARFNCKENTKLLNKSWGTSNKKRYGIKLYTPHRNWKFFTQNNDERQEWIKAFEQVSGTKASNTGN